MTVRERGTHGRALSSHSFLITQLRVHHRRKEQELKAWGSLKKPWGRGEGRGEGRGLNKGERRLVFYLSRG